MLQSRGDRPTSLPDKGKLRARHIGDFRRWKEHYTYQKSLDLVLRDLKVQKTDGKL
jgi:hypothetical protein